MLATIPLDSVYSRASLSAIGTPIYNPSLFFLLLQNDFPLLIMSSILKSRFLFNSTNRSSGSLHRIIIGLGIL